MIYLILGANGLIGQQFVRLCEERGINYVGTRYSREVNHLKTVNFLEPESLKAALELLAVSDRVIVSTADTKISTDDSDLKEKIRNSNNN